MASDHTYTIRYGIEMLMNLYLEEDFKPEYPKLVAAVQSEEYYVNMMMHGILRPRWRSSGMR